MSIEYRGWKARKHVDEVHINPERVFAVAQILDSGLPTPGIGDPLPPLWHWAATADWANTLSLGAEGHPRRGAETPPVDLPRRMFGGGTVEFHGEIPVGATVRRESEVTDIAEKTGRSGRLIVVTHTTVLCGTDGEPALTEKLNILYREAAQPGTEPAELPNASAPGPLLTPQGQGTWRFMTDPTVLMRFSAATANAHRIHYDWPYTTREEGYPGIVVHGPLQSVAMAEAHRLTSDKPVRTLTHRGTAPLFCGEEAVLTYTADDAGAQVSIARDGTTTSQVTLGF